MSAPPGSPPMGPPPRGPSVRGPPPPGSPQELGRAGGYPTGPPTGGPPPRGPPPIMIPPGSPAASRGPPPRGPPPRGPPPRGPPPRGPPPRGPSPRGPPPGSPGFGSPLGGPPRGPPPRGPPPRGPPPPGSPQGPGGGEGYARGPPPRGPPPRGPPPTTIPPGSPAVSPQGLSPRGSPPGSPGFDSPSGAPPRGPPPRGPPPRGPPPTESPTALGMSPGGPWDSSPRGPPPRGPSPGPPPGPPGSPPRGPPPRGPPLGVGPPRGPPRMPPGGAFPGPPLGSPPRGPLPRGPPPRGPPPGVGPPGMTGARGPPMGSPGGGTTVMPGSPGGLARGPPPIGPPSGPPRGMPPRGPPPRGPPPRGPPPSRGPPAPPSGSKITAEPPQPAAAPRFGHLIIKCVKGFELKAGSGMFGKADPYCKVTIGSQEFSTRPHKGGGKNPVWNEEHAFEISSEKEAVVEILDKENVGEDKFMGELKVNILDWVSKGSFKGDLEVFDKSGKGVGSIYVAVKFERPGATGAGPGLSVGPVVATSARPAGAPPAHGASDPFGEFTDEEIWEAFVSFDLDKNNFIGAAEVRHVLVNIGEQATDAEVDEMIRMVDKDGDGQGCFVEFYKMVTGGKLPSPGLGQARVAVVAPSSGGATRGGSAATTSATAAVQNVLQNAVQQRNKKKQALNEFARDNSIKHETIKKAYKRFQTTNKDSSGMIDYTEFCEIMQVDPSPQSEGLFQLFDGNRSGVVDVREFMIALTNFAGAAKEDKLKFAFSIFDEDGNGVITKQELTCILKANHMAQTEAEVARKTDTIMAQADKDGDGVVTFDEFVIVCKKFPNILFPSTGKQ